MRMLFVLHREGQKTAFSCSGPFRGQSKSPVASFLFTVSLRRKNWGEAGGNGDIERGERSHNPQDMTLVFNFL